MSNYMVYVGIAIGVAAIAGAIVYGTQQQQAHIPKDVVPAPATEQGSFASPSGLGAQLNKEKWHTDPFGDIAKKVREQAGQ
ncbi:MAG: hypothetical protein K8Q89_07755 [Nitrosarchaeum sp.]|nr:hypothetical protein [Nitrosarchaeum sp.]